METHSEPTIVTETVTDLDIGLSSGEVRTLTLRAQDGFKEGEAAVIVWIYEPPETITFFKQHVAWMCTRVRLIKRQIPTPEAIKKPRANSSS